jgi:hypothetical protein
MVGVGEAEGNDGCEIGEMVTCHKRAFRFGTPHTTHGIFLPGTLESVVSPF